MMSKHLDQVGSGQMAACGGGGWRLVTVCVACSVLLTMVGGAALPSDEGHYGPSEGQYRLPDGQYRPSAGHVERLKARPAPRPSPTPPVVAAPAPPPPPPPPAAPADPAVGGPDLSGDLLAQLASSPVQTEALPPHVDTFNVVVTSNGSTNTSPQVTVLPPGTQVGIMRVLSQLSGHHRVGNQSFKVEEATAQLIKHPDSDLVLATMNNNMVDERYMRMIMRGLLGQQIDPSQRQAVLSRHDVDKSYLSRLLNTTIRRNNNFYVNTTSKTNVVNIYVINVVTEEDGAPSDAPDQQYRPPDSPPAAAHQAPQPPADPSPTPAPPAGSSAYRPPRPGTEYRPPQQAASQSDSRPSAAPGTEYRPPQQAASQSDSRPSAAYSAPRPQTEYSAPQPPSSYQGPRPASSYGPPRPSATVRPSFFGGAGGAAGPAANPASPGAGLRPPSPPPETTTHDPLYYFTVTITPPSTTTTTAAPVVDSPNVNHQNLTVGSILSLLPNVFPAAANAFNSVPFPNVSAAEDDSILGLLPHNFNPANYTYAESVTVNPMKQLFGHTYDYKHALGDSPPPVVAPPASLSDPAPAPAPARPAATNQPAGPNMFNTLMPTVAASALAFSPLWLPLFLGRRRKRSTQIISPHAAGAAADPARRVHIPEAWLGYLRGVRGSGALGAPAPQKQSKADVVSRPLMVMDAAEPLTPQQEAMVSSIISSTMNGGFSGTNTAVSVSERYPGLQGYEALQDGVINSIQTLRDQLVSSAEEPDGSGSYDPEMEPEEMAPEQSETTNSPVTFITLSTAAQPASHQASMAHDMMDSMKDAEGGAMEPVTDAPQVTEPGFRPMPSLRPRPIPTILSQENAAQLGVTLTTEPTTTAEPPATAAPDAQRRPTVFVNNRPVFPATTPAPAASAETPAPSPEKEATPTTSRPASSAVTTERTTEAAPATELPAEGPVTEVTQDSLGVKELQRQLPLMGAVMVAGTAVLGTTAFLAFGKRRRRRRSAEKSAWPIDLDAMLDQLLTAEETHSRPEDQEDHSRPEDQEAHSRPEDQEDHSRPEDQEDHSEPAAGEDHSALAEPRHSKSELRKHGKKYVPARSAKSKSKPQ
ncbi:hypothetical protein FJT64_000046 [Amphibalanus amphitrite]|uniref:Uncharacterized protein n=1 Tax=Amphibalanus amphitrite TaxID=1232801 RepID=A0A6A4XEF2_AMPAM|nr:hypothetical protein FJT64_000046 [Amphibalanus amphitrite]